MLIRTWISDIEFTQSMAVDSSYSYNMHEANYI